MKYVGPKAFRTLTLPDAFALSEYITASHGLCFVKHDIPLQFGTMEPMGGKAIAIRRNAVA
jgi:hypothetical protein